ncbi:MAG: sugar transferase [Candidatus Acidiferrales bacterium]
MTTRAEFYEFAKRATDVAISAFVLLALLPVFALLCVWIKFDSAGSAIYRGVRVGREGQMFEMFKFRTMIADAEARGGSCTADDDPRITKAGRILRKYKLDEIPQFANVFIGDMSLVGPRPEVEQFTSMFTPEERAILTVRPGITDWATLWDSEEGLLLSGSSDPEGTYIESIRPEKIRLQLEYVRKRSFSVDIEILAATAGMVITNLLRGRRVSIPPEFHQSK